MQKIIISGCNGHMGRVVADICATDPQVEVVAGIDILGQPNPNFPVFSSPAACDVKADAVIDFSHPSALAPLLEMCQARNLPVVLATTWPPQAMTRHSWRPSRRPPPTSLCFARPTCLWV